MSPRVSVPKIFLRGSKWYVRVQVPKSMQDRLKRKEYWVSLRTSDRADALRHATTATRKKRRDISAVYRRLSAIKETFHELDADQQLALGREAYATHVRGGADLIAEFEASSFDTLKAFTAARSETVDDLVARLRLARSDTPHIRVMVHTLMEENGIRLPEGSLAFQQLLEICADTFIEAKRNELAQLRGRAVHDAPKSIGISGASFSRMENGLSKVTMDRLETLAALYEVSASALVEGSIVTRPSTIDIDRLKLVVETVQQVVNDRAAHPSPEKMAMAVSELYRLEITHIVNDATAVFDPSRHLGIIQTIFGE